MMGGGPGGSGLTSPANPANPASPLSSLNPANPLSPTNRGFHRHSRGRGRPYTSHAHRADQAQQQYPQSSFYNQITNLFNDRRQAFADLESKMHELALTVDALQNRPIPDTEEITKAKQNVFNCLNNHIKRIQPDNQFNIANASSLNRQTVQTIQSHLNSDIQRADKRKNYDLVCDFALGLAAFGSLIVASVGVFAGGVMGGTIATAAVAFDAPIAPLALICGIAGGMALGGLAGAGLGALPGLALFGTADMLGRFNIGHYYNSLPFHHSSDRYEQAIFVRENIEGITGLIETMSQRIEPRNPQAPEPPQNSEETPLYPPLNLSFEN